MLKGRCFHRQFRPREGRIGARSCKISRRRVARWDGDDCLIAFAEEIHDNCRLNFLSMAKQNEAQLLELLKAILPRAVTDPKLAEKIYSACEKEITAKERVTAFEKLCKRIEVPNLEKNTLAEVKKQLEQSFGPESVSLVPHPGKKAISVEVVTPSGTFESVIKIGASATHEEEENGEKITFAALPVSLETDATLVWMLGRDERMTAEEASIALAKVQEGFWESKAGQQHLRKRVERTFPEFIAKVPSKMLTEVGLRRHYKDPEPLKTIRPLKARRHE